ncbi:MAG: GNAT family N-acetyltransferase [Tranquillimonas sp.]
MSVTLTLAQPDDLDRTERLVAACHEAVGIPSDEEARRDALAPLLEGTPHGALYLIGPPKSPVGYAALTFGWSVEYAGVIARVDEIFIRHGVRGRGMGTEALSRLAPVLTRHGIRAVEIDIDPADERLRRLYARIGFRPRRRPGTLVRRP